VENFKTFYNRLSSFHDLEAVVDKDVVYTYRDLLSKISEYENYLKSNNISENSLISIYSKTSFESICLFICLCKTGHTIIPISEISKNKREHFQEISTADYEICFSNSEINLKQLNSVEKKHDYYEKLKNKKSCGLVVFSSGSTGKNKAAVHDLNFIFEKFVTKRKKMRVVSFLLFDHLGGINTFLYTLSNGGCLIIPKDRTPDLVLESIEKFQGELLPTSPSFINFLLISGKILNYDLSSLKMISYGTELMHEHTLRKMRELMPQIHLLQTYGLTEIGVLRSKSLSNDSLWVKLGGPEFQTRVVEGKLQIKGNSTMLGYLNHDNPFTEDGWLITGDNVEVNGEYYKILGRDSDIINVGGQKVYPAEVENVILELENVSDVSVFSQSNTILGNIVCANICLKQDESISQLKKRVKKHCSLKLEKFKIPIRIKVVDKIQNTRFKRVRRTINDH